MSVEHHKTALEGVAKVVMEAVDHGRVVHYVDNSEDYVDTIRNVQVCKTDTNNLFVLTGGCLLGNLSSKIKSIGNRYGLCLPSATRVHKIGATSVALTLGQSPTHSTNVPHNKHRSAALSGHCRERARCFSICNHDSALDRGETAAMSCRTRRGHLPRAKPSGVDRSLQRRLKHGA